ncbi:MAG: FAD-binding oxidoreductase [Acidobacteria bacterium]|nr:FAD-binding oxidoreductase [Acidobacteriota bacterium]
MTTDKTELSNWTRREFVRAGLATAGALALGACGHRGNLYGSLTNESSADLDALARSIRGRFLLSKSSGYDDARKVWNLAYDRHPLAMARCADLDDVRRCVEFARRHSIPVAIRGGGHSYAGHGVADGALQIDLAAFNAVKVDSDRRVASVGGGTKIKELLTATLPAGLITPMGACGDVGVAGLALAGGDTAGRGLFGTACDNVIGAQIVTSDGEVLELGPGRNEDLFWAIRGGGGNFGIVTRLDVRLHSVLPYHSAGFKFGWNDIAGAMQIFGELVQDPPDEIRAGFYVDPVAGASASCGFYGDARAAGAYLAKWKTAFRPVEPLMTNPKPNPQGEIWTTTSLAVDGAFLEGMTGDVVEVLARAAVAGRGIGGMLMGLSNGVASRVGMTDTAYPLRGTGLSSLLSAEWSRPQDREAAMQWVAVHGAALRPWARRAYVNYLSPSTPDRIREVYGANYPRLARIKAQYDPANLFRSNQNIVPEARS